MGSAVKATCKCGYEETFMIGGGMQNFHTFCAFPVLCKKCKAIVTANLLAQPLCCPACESSEIVPYDDKELRKRKGRHCVAEWGIKEQLGRKLQLTDGLYYCPNCDSFDLTFTQGDICWD